MAYVVPLIFRLNFPVSEFGTTTLLTVSLGFLEFVIVQVFLSPVASVMLPVPPPVSVQPAPETVVV